jgi:hypothetical protein
LLYVWVGLDHDPPTYGSYVARMTGVLHQTQLLLVEMGSLKFFAWAVLKPLSFNLCPLDIWDYRCEPLHSAKFFDFKSYFFPLNILGDSTYHMQELSSCSFINLVFVWVLYFMLKSNMILLSYST